MAVSSASSSAGGGPSAVAWGASFWLYEQAGGPKRLTCALGLYGLLWPQFKIS